MEELPELEEEGRRKRQKSGERETKTLRLVVYKSNPSQGMEDSRQKDLHQLL
jgi:hypothetical protein